MCVWSRYASKRLQLNDCIITPASGLFNRRSWEFLSALQESVLILLDGASFPEWGNEDRQEYQVLNLVSNLRMAVSKKLRCLFGECGLVYRWWWAVENGKIFLFHAVNRSVGRSWFGQYGVGVGIMCCHASLDYNKTNRPVSLTTITSILHFCSRSQYIRVRKTSAVVFF